IANPVKYSDKAPVGSGPYTVRGSNCNAQRIIYTKNTHYWQKGKPKIDTVVYPAYTDNSPANVALATGQDQWGGQFIPNIKHSGFKLKKGFFYTKSGKPLSFTMINIAGYTDWIASAGLVQDELKKIGIKITTSNISGGSYDDATFNGHFELAYDGNEAGGPS